jgi:hypothetical protein
MFSQLAGLFILRAVVVVVVVFGGGWWGHTHTHVNKQRPKL